MNFDMSDKQKEWRDRVRAFMDEHVRPRCGSTTSRTRRRPRWKVLPVVEELKEKARAEGLWNLFMPPNAHDDDEFDGPGLTNLEYALLRGGDGPHLLGLGGVQLLGARHRQHGGPSSATAPASRKGSG